ncbi:hypothetical protein ACWDBW_08565 [Streptomyces sp. NPDC001107]
MTNRSRRRSRTTSWPGSSRARLVLLSARGEEQAPATEEALKASGAD